MSAGWFALMLLLIWCTSTSFETEAYFHPLPVRLWKKFAGKYKEWRRASESLKSHDTEAGKQSEPDDS
jgi:hypothetical protein